jgi:hypothetical protein
MAVIGKILGQLVPAPDTLEDLYAVPTGAQTTVTSLSICNFGTDTDAFTVMLAESGGMEESKQYLYASEPIEGPNTFVATIGLTLYSDDVIRVRSSGSCAFQAFGLEQT